MHDDDFSPEERLDNLVARAQNESVEAEHAQGPDRKLARQRVRFAVAQAKKLAKAHGLDLPKLPILSDARKKTKEEGRPPTITKAHKAQVAPPPQMRKPTMPQPQASGGMNRSHHLAIDLGQAIEREVRKPKPLDAIRASISGIRAQTWTLLAALENLRPEQLAELAPELQLLDAAAHTALRLGEGRAA